MSYLSAHNMAEYHTLGHEKTIQESKDVEFD